MYELFLGESGLITWLFFSFYMIFILCQKCVLSFKALQSNSFIIYSSTPPSWSNRPICHNVGRLISITNNFTLTIRWTLNGRSNKFPKIHPWDKALITNTVIEFDLLSDIFHGLCSLYCSAKSLRLTSRHWSREQEPKIPD